MLLITEILIIYYHCIKTFLSRVQLWFGQEQEGILP